MNARKPIDWDELYPGRFIKAGELVGKKPTITISDVDTDELEGDNGKRVKGIISFRETTRQLALNKTNGICLREMFGRKVQEWVGKRITLFADKWNGDDAIRIWGSPELKSDRKVEIKLPRRRPFMMTMHATGKGKKKASEPDDEEKAAIAAEEAEANEAEQGDLEL